MQRSTSREQFNARASIDQRQKTSHTPNVKDHESSEGQQSNFQTMNFEDNKYQNVSRPQQHEMQVQTDTFLAQSQPFYPTGFD